MGGGIPGGLEVGGISAAAVMHQSALAGGSKKIHSQVTDIGVGNGNPQFDGFQCPVGRDPHAAAYAFGSVVGDEEIGGGFPPDHITSDSGADPET